MRNDLKADTGPQRVRQWMAANRKKRKPEKLAAKIEFSISTVNNFLAGRKVREEVIEAISDVTGIPEPLLWEGLVSASEKSRRAS